MNIQGPTKRVAGGEASTILIPDVARGVVIVETIVFNDNGTSSRAVRTVLQLRQIQDEHIAEIQRRGGN